MVMRRRVMRTRSSRSTSAGADGARTGAGAEAGFAAAPPWITDSMSPLVTRPSLPVPDTAAGLTPDSAARRRTDGASLSLDALGDGASAFGTARGFGSSSAALMGLDVSVFSFGLPVAPAFFSPAVYGGGSGLDRAEHGADIHGVAFLDGDFGQDAGGGRRNLDRHLVGFEFNKRFVGLHGVARLLEPFADGRFCYALAQSRNADLGCHFSPFYAAALMAARIYAKASSRNALSCARCLDIWPTAVEAAGGRPT